MNYINREYGYEGRPPFFKDYFEKKNKGLGTIFFKNLEKSIAGFGLDYSSPNGVLLAGKCGTIWGARISYYKVNKWVDAKDFLDNIGNFFAENRDGSFAYFNHGDIAANIINYKINELVLVVAGMTKVKVRIEFFPITKEETFLEEENNIIKGSGSKRTVIPGNIFLTDNDMEIKDRYDVFFDKKNSKKEYIKEKRYLKPNNIKKKDKNDFFFKKKNSEKEYFYAKSYFKPNNIIKKDDSIIYEYNLDEKFSRIVMFLAVGEEYIINSFPDIDEINLGSNKSELIYTTEKIVGSGILGENASNIVSRSMLHQIYDPYLLRTVLVEDRKKCHSYYSYDSTEMATGALIYALIGEYDKAINQLEPCFCDKILGPITAWIIFCRTRNKEALSRFFFKLMETFEINGENVVVDKMTLREIAYKQYGSPYKEIKSDDLYSLDMSCYKLLALDILCNMAQILKHKEYDNLYKAKIELKKNINLTFYNEKLGLYMDRYFNGAFGPIYGANSFLPLVAGAIDDINILERVIMNLNDNKKFSGEFLITSLEKGNPLYGKKTIDNYGREIGAYENYHGMINPTQNFLIYMGLKRYGINEIQTKMSVSCSKMYNNILKKYNMVPNFYIPEKNHIGKDITKNSLSGNLIGIIGMLEMFDTEYFRNDLRASISFGTLEKGENGLANIEIFGHKFSINISDNETKLVMDGNEVFRGNGGKFVVRNFVENSKGAEFIIFSKEDITLNINLPIFVRQKENKTLYTFNVEKGSNKVAIDKADKVKPTRIKFSI